jgi:actin-like ATPase involved in cell morphogenesis
MGYRLGVDLGTTWTAAAVARDGRTSIVPLGQRRAAIPSLVLLRADGSVLTGDAAMRRALTEPERVVREFKRRIGDTVPLLVAGTPYSAEALTARLLRAVIDHVTQLEGERPDHVAIAHPANWGHYKLELLNNTIRLAGLDPATTDLITEPEAAATAYASQERLDVGQNVCVYDLGGGTFDVAIVRRDPTGFAIVGRPDGIERLGGIDFDAAVHAHVTNTLGSHYHDLDPEDPNTLSAIARLRQDCIEAKEALSADTDTTIPILLPNHQTEIRLTRAEFEAIIRPTLQDTIDLTRQTIANANLTPQDIHRVLLVGGSSRIPLISQLIQNQLDVITTVDTHPKHAIAIGTAHVVAPPAAASPAAGQGAAPTGAIDPSRTTIAPAAATDHSSAPAPTVANDPGWAPAAAGPMDPNRTTIAPTGTSGPAGLPASADAEPVEALLARHDPTGTTAGRHEPTVIAGPGAAGDPTGGTGSVDPHQGNQDRSGQFGVPMSFLPEDLGTVRRQPAGTGPDSRAGEPAGDRWSSHPHPGPAPAPAAPAQPVQRSRSQPPSAFDASRTVAVSPHDGATMADHRSPAVAGAAVGAAFAHRGPDSGQWGGDGRGRHDPVAVAGYRAARPSASRGRFLAVAAIALVLLAAGGYLLLQQRPTDPAGDDLVTDATDPNASTSSLVAPTTASLAPVTVPSTTTSSTEPDSTTRPTETTTPTTEYQTTATKQTTTTTSSTTSHTETTQPTTTETTAATNTTTTSTTTTTTTEHGSG